MTIRKLVNGNYNAMSAWENYISGIMQINNATSHLSHTEVVTRQEWKVYSHNRSLLCSGLGLGKQRLTSLTNCVALFVTLTNFCLQFQTSSLLLTFNC